MLINRLNTAEASFDQQLNELLAWEDATSDQVEQSVKKIIADVRSRGDSAVLEYTNTFDSRRLSDLSETVIDEQALTLAVQSISAEQRTALEMAANRIREYHEKQLQSTWRYEDTSGNTLGQKVTPLDRVGLYAPGGKAAYPSSVLMAAIPAKVAGVQDVVLVSPAPKGKVNPIVLAAASIAGISRVITIGGAQAIAALAYGTQLVPKVDKIVGPGNIYVATAKRQVFGAVDIDMIAGPSEILIISDGTTPSDWLAMDLFSQAEHDEDAQSILITTDQKHLDDVYASIEKLLPQIQRRDIASVSLKKRGALILAQDEQDAFALVNRIAPEHLELSITDPERALTHIRHAGAIFMGRYTSESLGDYCAGPNHVLPTSGTARFSSPLGTYDFIKRSSIIKCSEAGASELGKIASILARSESLEAHARSAEYRISDSK